MRRALYVGTFDPPTKGHQSVIQAGSDLFDELVIGLALNPNKAPMFTTTERLAMLNTMARGFSNVSAEKIPIGFYTVDFAQKMDIQFLLRGIRNTTDFVYEQMMCEQNLRINQTIRTIFVMPEAKYSHVSSSSVREKMKFMGWEDPVRNEIPDVIWPQFYKHAEEIAEYNGFHPSR